MRQTGSAAFYPKRSPRALVTTLAYDFEPDEHVEEHFHEEDQLVYAVQGAMTLRAARGVCVVPPLRAVWVPAKVPHAIRMSGAVSMKTLYLRPRIAKLPRACTVLQVTPLLRELVVAICATGQLRAAVRREARLLAVLLDELEAARRAPPLRLPMPRDPRALRVATAVLADPSEPRPLASLCRRAGASKRTVERAFAEETKMTFGAWRRQVSLLRGVERLAAGDKVTAVAVDAGYRSTSAFIAMFRRALGTTPGEYFG
jgi:methylphosphotriester-DNA--protein-cysteine methyltransferase